MAWLELSADFQDRPERQAAWATGATPTLGGTPILGLAKLTGHAILMPRAPPAGIKALTGGLHMTAT